MSEDKQTLDFDQLPDLLAKVREKHEAEDEGRPISRVVWSTDPVVLQQQGVDVQLGSE